MPPVVTRQNSLRPGKTTKSNALTAGDIISRIGDMEVDDWLKINLYGRSGTGKTTLWSSFPDPILAVLCSGGKRPGELKSIKTPENAARIKSVVLNESQEIRQLTKWLTTNQGKFQTVVLDHATGLQDLVLCEILGLEEIPEQKGWGLASQQQYGQCTQQCKEYLRALLNLPANVVIVAQQREYKTEGDDSLIEPFVASAMTPSLAAWLFPACDYICQTLIRNKVVEKQMKMGGKTTTQRVKTNEVEYCLRTAPGPVYTTKFRVPKGHPLPEFIVDPDYDKIMAIIRGEEIS